MAGRDYLSRDTLKPKRDSHSHSHSHSRRTLTDSPPRQHDDPTIHHREIQSLLIDNQRLAATHVALKQELSVALQDLRHLSAAAGKIKADRAAEVREVFEKAVKMEAEVRLIDELRADLVRVIGDVQKLNKENKEFSEKLEMVQGELGKERGKEHQYLMLKAEIENVHKELQKGRAAVEYEKKVYDANLEQNQAMEKSRNSMVQEIEKLQADLANAHKKAKAAAAAAATNTPGYGAGYGYGSYPGPYVGHQVPGGNDPQYGPMPHGPYGMHHHMVNPHYAAGTAPHGTAPHGTAPHGLYDTQHANAHG